AGPWRQSWRARYDGAGGNLSARGAGVRGENDAGSTPSSWSAGKVRRLERGPASSGRAARDRLPPEASSVPLPGQRPQLRPTDADNVRKGDRQRRHRREVDNRAGAQRGHGAALPTPVKQITPEDDRRRGHGHDDCGHPKVGGREPAVTEPEMTHQS